MKVYSWEDWEDHRTKWKIFQQATFDCQRITLWEIFVTGIFREFSENSFDLPLRIDVWRV
jgi:hypothetical protein